METVAANWGITVVIMTKLLDMSRDHD